MHGTTTERYRRHTAARLGPPSPNVTDRGIEHSYFHRPAPAPCLRDLAGGEGEVAAQRDREFGIIVSDLIAVRLQAGNLVRTSRHSATRSTPEPGPDHRAADPACGPAPRSQLTSRGFGPGPRYRTPPAGRGRPVFEADVGAQVFLPTRWHRAERQPPLADAHRGSAFLYARSGCGLRRQSPRVQPMAESSRPHSRRCSVRGAQRSCSGRWAP